MRTNHELAPPLPTLEGARGKLRIRNAPWWKFWKRSNLLRREPEASARLGVLWLDARLLIRSTRRSEEHVGPRTLAGLSRQESKDEGASRHLARKIDPAPKPCTFCSMSPGTTLCGSCGGDGHVDVKSGDRIIRVSCQGCLGLGGMECGACDGSAESQRVEIEWVQDEWKELRYAYVPALDFELETELRSYAESIEAWPESLSMPLEEVLVSGPYRSGPPAAEEFHGFVVDGPIDEARGVVERLRGEGRVLKADVRSFVLPFLRLRYSDTTLVIYRDTATHSFGYFVGDRDPSS